MSIAGAMVAGCGASPNGNQGSQTLLVGVSSALSAAHSFRMSVAGTVHDEGRAAQAFRGAGVVDWASKRADLKIVAAGQTARLIIVGATTYISRTNAAGSGGPTWLRVSSAANRPALGGLLDVLGDPVTTLSSLSHRLLGVTSRGKTSLGDVSTTELSGRLRAWGPGVVGTITIWIDQEGRLRQLHLTGTGSGRSADITEQLSDFGTAVHVVAPPANEVATSQPPLGGLGLSGRQLGTCRGFLAFPATTRLAEASTVLNTLRGGKSSGRPASERLRTAFTSAAVAACAQRPHQSWSLVIGQLYFDHRQRYSR